MGRPIVTLGQLQDYVGRLVARYGREAGCNVHDTYHEGAKITIYPLSTADGLPCDLDIEAEDTIPARAPADFTTA